MLGFLSPTSRIATTARTGNGVTRDIEVWDIRTRTRLLRVERVPATHDAAPGDLAVSDLALNEHVVLGPGVDGEVWIRVWVTASWSGSCGRFRMAIGW